MKVKICGLTRNDDVALINRLQPDYAGFVLAPGRHQLTLTQLESLTSQLEPGILKVGVFVNAKPEEVLAAVNAGTLQAVQLHGDEDAAYITRLRGSLRQAQLSPSIWKAVRLGSKNRQDPSWVNGALAAYKAAGVSAFLFDSWSDQAYGGVGRRFDLNLLAPLRPHLPFFLAGGLSWENVGSIAKQVRNSPVGNFLAGVDVSSGVEKNGVKDPELTAAFIHAASLQK